MAQLVSLSDEDIAALRSELAAGRSPMVWFTPAAVGVPAGDSAKVVAFDDVTEGDFVQVRPTGSKDVLSFSPSELTRTRPPRKKAAAAPRTPRTASPVKPAAPPRPAAAPQPPAPAKPPAPSKPPAAPPKPATPQPATAKPATAQPQPGRVPAKPVRRAGRAAASPELTVTLSSTAAGEWSVEVTVGAKRTVRPVPVAPADVARAARALPPPVAEAVDRALDTARRQQEERVAQLQAELERAQRALEDLG